MQRGRLARLLVASSLIGLLVTGGLLGASSLATSTSTMADATHDLLAIDDVRAPVADELARALPALYPPGVLAEDTSAAVAQRMVRDPGFVDDAGRAVAAAHQTWKAGGEPALELGSDIVTPAALAALRDVDLALARSFPPSAVVRTEPVALPVDVDVDSVDRVERIAVVGLVVSLLGVAVGAVLDRRRDRVVRQISTALLAGAALLAAIAVGLPLPDLRASAPLALIAALVAAARTTLLLVALGAAFVGAFLRAVASQMAPLVDVREQARERAAAGPLPASSGSQAPRRRGRVVRQQAVDAFFDRGRSDDGHSEDDDPAAPLHTPSEPLRVAYHGDGFDAAIAAVESDPAGGVQDSHGAGDDADDQAADLVAERREALERIDGSRSRLRTHLRR